MEEITLLMIPDEKDWYYLAAKKETALVKEVTSKNNIDFYCLNCLHSFRTENKPKCYEKVCKSKKKNWRIALPTQKNNVLEFNQL